MILNLEQLKCEHYEHIISLGSFCSPALELERLGFRDGSYPFDWILSHTFKKVLDLIDTSFKEAFVPNQLYQRRDARQIYENKLFDLIFVHDFSGYESFDRQYKNFNEKYQRRIKRFYDSIIEPTLFIRYIETKAELSWICSEQMNILFFLKTFNKLNEILYITNYDTAKNERIQNIPILIVEKDKNDTVARRFFEQGEEVVEFLHQHYSIDARKRNLEYFKEKRIRKRCLQLIKKLYGIIKKEYVHDKVI